MRWETKPFSRCTPDDVFEWAKLRTDVFFLEQDINEEELDSWDRHCDTTHVWCCEGGQMVGYARIVRKPEADEGDYGVTTSIGRVVVAASHRRKGIAADLLTRCLGEIGPHDVIVHSQVHVQDLYRRAGFVAVGESFEEAGIAHTRMIRRHGDSNE